MSNPHEPHDAFVDRLEAQIAGDVRRRNREARAPIWVFQSRMRTVVAAALLAIVSMSIGGAAVAAAYQAQTNELRDQVARTYQLRLDLARKNLDLAAQVLQTTQGKFKVGLANRLEVMDAEDKVREGQAQLQSLELQLAEVRLTGREPRNEVSAPLVSGRDFVGDRLRIDLTVPRSALEIEQMRLRDVQTRVQIGVADRIEVAVAEAKVMELQAALVGFERKLGIRLRFLKGEIDGVQADLRVLEAEAEQRLQVLKPRLDLALRQLQQTAERVNAGAAPEIELAEARLKRQQLEVDLAKAELDLALIRQRLAGK